VRDPLCMTGAVGSEMRERWQDVDGMRVHVVEWGDGALRVLLVHGLGGNTVSWEPVGPPLAERLDATVTAVDLPGYGLTRLPRGFRADFDTHRRVLDAVLERLGAAVVVGNSMGGSLSVALTARHPELVRALVLVDPAQPLGPGQHPHWGAVVRMAPCMVPPLGRFVIRSRGRLLGAERLVDETLATTLVDAARCDPEIRRRLIAMATTRASFPEASGAFVDSTRNLFWYLTRSFDRDLERVDAPTLLVHGQNDRLVAVAASRALAARRPEFRLEIIDDCGHTPQLECPDHFVDLVASWVAETLATPAPAAETLR
jgi:pimeloyl-ACP methyl ester carboxylesterase